MIRVREQRCIYSVFYYTCSNIYFLFFIFQQFFSNIFVDFNLYFQIFSKFHRKLYFGILSEIVQEDTNNMKASLIINSGFWSFGVWNGFASVPLVFNSIKFVNYRSLGFTLSVDIPKFVIKIKMVLALIYHSHIYFYIFMLIVDSCNILESDRQE